MPFDVGWCLRASRSVVGRREDVISTTPDVRPVAHGCGVPHDPSVRARLEEVARRGSRTSERGLDLPGGGDQVRSIRFGDSVSRLRDDLADERVELPAADGLPARRQLPRSPLDLDLQAVLDPLVEPERRDSGVEIRELLLRRSTVERIAGIADTVTVAVGLILVRDEYAVVDRIGDAVAVSICRD